MKIIPENLDIVIREFDYAIYNGQNILLTPDGNEFTHSGIRLLQHILRELTFDKNADSNLINCYSIYCYQKDYVEQNLGVLTRNFFELLECDPFMRKKFTSEVLDFTNNSASIFEDLENEWQPLHFIYGGATIVSRVFNDFIYERMPKGYDISNLTFNEASKIVHNYYLSLSDDKKAAVNLLAKNHFSGIITPMFLVNLRITPSEYANAVFNLNLPHFRNNTILEKYVSLIENDLCLPPVIRKESPKKDFEKVKDDALSAVEYVVLIKEELSNEISISELLTDGESYNVEFKSTLRMNLKTNKKDANIEHASLKTIAAFLNSGGGTLLIGVQDNSEILGISADEFDNEDRFSLHFWNLIKASIGQDVSSYIQTKFETIASDTIFIAKCSRSTRPVFLKQSGFNEEFFIRVGPSSAKLEISEALKYIKERFE